MPPNFRFVVDCSTGEGKLTQFTAADETDHTARMAAFAQRDTAARQAASQRTADLATIKQKAATDPAFAALARLLGG